MFCLAIEGTVILRLRNKISSQVLHIDNAMLPMREVMVQKVLHHVPKYVNRTGNGWQIRGVLCSKYYYPDQSYTPALSLLAAIHELSEHYVPVAKQGCNLSSAVFNEHHMQNACISWYTDKQQRRCAILINLPDYRRPINLYLGTTDQITQSKINSQVKKAKVICDHIKENPGAVQYITDIPVEVINAMDCIEIPLISVMYVKSLDKGKVRKN